jgi:glycosyltransferase involved in cell wall biosynthesis
MTNQFDKPGKKKESFIPPKFCILSPWYVKEGMGGTEIQNYYIAQALMERGWEVHYIRETPAKISGKEKRDNGIILHAISRLSNHFKWLNLYSIFKISKKIKPRVWYIRGNISYVFPTVICAKLLGGVIIWNCSSELQVSSRKQALKKLNYYEKPFALINRYLYEKSLPYVDRRIVQTQNQKHMLKTNLKLSSSVLYNAHPKTERSGTERRPVILFIANLKPVKQPHLFIELAERCKNSQYIFKMVGKPGDKELMEKISEAQKTNKNFNFPMFLFRHGCAAFQ